MDRAATIPRNHNHRKVIFFEGLKVEMVRYDFAGGLGYMVPVQFQKGVAR